MTADFREWRSDPQALPMRWVFRLGEVISATFGIVAHRHPRAAWVAVYSQVGPALHFRRRVSCEWKGRCEGLRIARLELCDLPPGAYRWEPGYRDESGVDHACDLVRLFVIDEDVPRSLDEIEETLIFAGDDEVVTGPAPRVAISPAPMDWAARTMYAVMIDRFAPTGAAEGASSGDRSIGNRRTPAARHGGTLEGLRSRLPYLRQLGIGALLLSPVVVNPVRDYHGYHPLHLLMVDPAFGSLDDLRSLVAQAHAHGIAVVLDMVCNHMAPLIDWDVQGGSDHEFHYHARHRGRHVGDAQPGGSQFLELIEDVLPYPLEFRCSTRFHDPTETRAERQRLFGFLEDHRTEVPDVRRQWIRVLKYWIAQTDVDGFRYDAVKHVDADFWRYATAEIANYTRTLGKTGFQQIGEHSGPGRDEVDGYRRLGFTSMIDYPAYYASMALPPEKLVLAVAGEATATAEAAVDGACADYRFLDNQDCSRIAHKLRAELDPPASVGPILRCLMIGLLWGRGRPYLYYGTEQEFSGAIGTYFDEEQGRWEGHDFHVREDMFDNPECHWRFGPVNQARHPAFCTSHETFRAISAAARFRRDHGAAFCRGERARWSSPGDMALAAQLRDPHGGADVLIALNPTRGPATISGHALCAPGAEISPGPRSPGSLFRRTADGRLEIHLEPFGYFGACAGASDI